MCTPCVAGCTDYVALLGRIVGPQHVFETAAEKAPYERDHTGNLAFACRAVVKPADAGEVAAVLRLCNGLKIPVTPRGAGTGVTGGALPVHGGIVLSLERFNRILDVDPVRRVALVEAGVVTQELCNAARRQGLYYPLMPGSGGSSFIGGNLASSAGSPKSAKYGVIREYVMALEVVLPTGEIVWTGANVRKNATGFNLSELFIGSEGTLGIITKALIRLIPAPAHEVVLLSAYPSVRAALAAVASVMQAGITPAAVELVCRDALRLTAQYVAPGFPHLHEGVAAQLLVELDGGSAGQVMQEAEQVALLLEAHCEGEIVVGDTAAARSRLWSLRHKIGEAMTGNNLQYRDVDACVPLPRLLEYLEGVAAICAAEGLPTACFGHVADGNLHTMLLVSRQEEIYRNPRIDRVLQQVYRLAAALGGTLSGEHGVGLLQKDFLALALSTEQRHLMQRIKHLFDPHLILNPGKIFTTL